jgi:hypothetical protein
MASLKEESIESKLFPIPPAAASSPLTEASRGFNPGKP